MICFLISLECFFLFLQGRLSLALRSLPTLPTQYVWEPYSVRMAGQRHDVGGCITSFQNLRYR